MRHKVLILDDEPSMCSLLSLALRDGYDTVVALGGDGVVHEVASGLMRIPEAFRPRLAIIPIHREAKSDFRSLDLPQELKDKVHTESVTLEDVKIVIK